MEGIVLDHRGKPSAEKQSVKDALRERAKTDSRFLTVLENLDHGWTYPDLRASRYDYEEMITPERVVCADGVEITNTVTETIMCPDFTFAGDSIERGMVFKYTLLFDFSMQAAANTLTLRLRWGGVGGTALATSGAFAPDPTGASTAVSAMVEYWIVVRSDGAAGSMFTMGRMTMNDFDDATATTLQGNLNMMMLPVSAPSAVGSLDTTTSKALSPTAAFSAAAATNELTNHIAILESLN